MTSTTAAPPMTRRPPPLVLLALVTAIAPVALHMLVPALPELAPAIVAYLAQWGGWRADCVLLGMIGAAVLILTGSRLAETHARTPVNFVGMSGSFLVLLRTPAFLSFGFATAFTSASWFTFL